MEKHNAIVKPQTDKKVYRMVTLQSGTKVLLVHTPSSTADSSSTDSHKDSQQELKAAAALAVEVGSYSDPESLEGCAHFLEVRIDYV
jgi:insulysin